MKYTREVKVTASVKNVLTRGKSSAVRDFNGEYITVSVLCVNQPTSC